MGPGHPPDGGRRRAPEDGSMPAIRHVPVAPLALSRFEPVLLRQQWQAVASAAEHGRDMLRGRTVWNVNSTEFGGGVAELLRSLLGYARGAGVDARWVVIDGDPD